MPDDLRTYFEAIEDAFCRRRGAPLLLSPLDFEKAVEWYAAGISVEAVQEGIAAYFLRLASRKVPLRRAICLSFAEEEILKAREARRAAAVGRQAGLAEEKPPAERVAGFLGRAVSALEGFAAKPAHRESMPVLCRFAEQAAEELRSLADDAGRPFTALEAILAPLDQEMARLVLLESDPPLVDGWKAAARARLGDLAGTMEPRALAATVERLARQSALSHWGLPRLSLLYMEQ